MSTLEKMIAEVDTLRSVSQYLTWLARLNLEDFSAWILWPTADYYCRGAIEEEQRKRQPANYGLRLTIELVPSPCWYGSLREKMSRAAWDKLRKQVYARYQWRCGVCHTSNVTLHCHEIWHYDDKQHIQKLTGFICLCAMCHHCKHMGKAGLLASEGKLDLQRVIEHFLGVNQCSHEAYESHSNEARHIWGLSTVGTKSRNSPLNWLGEGTEEAFFDTRKKRFSMKFFALKIVFALFISQVKENE